MQFIERTTCRPRAVDVVCHRTPGGPTNWDVRKVAFQTADLRPHSRFARMDLSGQQSAPLGQRAGRRSESFHFLFKIDVVGQNDCTSLNWVRKGCELEELLFLSAIPGGFNLDNYQVREARCISPSLSQSHL